MAVATAPADLSAQALFARGVERHLAGDVPAAIASYEQALSRDPSLAEACNNLATLVVQLGDESRAEALLQRALILHPDYGEAQNNLGILLSSRGEHGRALSAFERAVSLEPTKAGWLNNLGNAYIEHFRFAEALDAFDRVIAINPGDADCWSNRALALRGLRRPDEAITSLRRALAIAPSHINALSNLGIILKEAKRLAEAEEVLQRATEIDPGNPHIWGNLAAVFEAAGDGERMRACATRSAELDPHYPEAYNLLANGEMEAGRYDAALALYERSLALDPSNRNANWNVGLIWLLHGDFERGWKQFEWRKRLQSVVFDHGTYAGQPWDGSPLQGRDILVHSEQGIGDAIQFIRYAPLLKARGARRVYLECPYPIVPLLSGVTDVDAVIARGVALPNYDVHANLMSLPGLLGTTLDSIPASVPYIPVEPRTARALVTGGDGALTVGFVWAGNPIHGRDFLRSAPLDAFRTLCGVEGTRFYSLQKGETAERQLAERPIPGVVNLAPHLDDFRDTAAVLDALDLVITVDTSVAHLAGALGKETWLLLPHVPDFRWMLEREDSPWYPTMRLFRQPSPRDWDSVFARVHEALRERVRQPMVREATRASHDDTVVTLASATRIADGRARFDLWFPLARLAEPAAFAEYEAELVHGGFDLPLRAFLDEFVSARDVVVDLEPGLGLTALSAATAPELPSAIILADRDAGNAGRVGQVVGRRAPTVAIGVARSVLDALQRGAQAGEGHVVVRVGDESLTAAVVAAIEHLEAGERPQAILWSAVVPSQHAAAIAALETLGMVTATLSIVDGEPALDAIEQPDAVQSLLALTGRALEALEARALAARERATASDAARLRPIEVSIGLPRLAGQPSALVAETPAPGQRPAATRRDVGIDWELRADTGWGVYGTNLALELERSESARPAIFAADTQEFAPITRFRLDRALREGLDRVTQLQRSAVPLTFDGLMLRALGNNFAHGALWDRISASRNAGVIFFEDTAFDAGALRRARALDLIVTGSHWNEEVLRARGLTNVATVLQGIDPAVFHPAERSGHLADRFVIFSGGKLEYRKGQDLVVAAFRAFRQRHSEALLLTAWHNNWPHLITDLDLAGHVHGVPSLDGQRLAVPEWLHANGIPSDAVLDVGRVPNALMGQVVREADVALFPNRCEGGTNLVAMECMAAGVPTIVSENSGHRDLVSTGGTLPLTRQHVVAPPSRFYRSVEGWGESDVDEMVDALERIYTNRSEAQSIARHGADAMARMTWQHQVQHLLATLAPLM